MMKKVVKFISLTFLSFSCFAGDGGTYRPASNLIVRGSYNYFKPINSDLDYAVVNAPPSHTVQTIYPHANSGFDIFLGYFFPNQHNFVNVEWQNFSSKSSNQVTSNEENITPTFETATPFTNSYAKGTVNYNVNRVDFMYGHVFSEYAPFIITPQAGVRYFKIKRQLHAFFVGAAAPDLSLAPFSQFEGAGPRFVLNMDYLFYPQFTFVAAAGGSVLIGQAQANSIHRRPAIVLDIAHNQVTHAIPEIDGKLGVRYTEDAGYFPAPLSVEVGFQATSYINAIDRLNPVVDPGGLISLQRVESTFTLMGLYVTVGFN